MKMRKSDFKTRMFIGACVSLLSLGYAVPKNVLHYCKVGYYNHVGGIKGGTTALNTLATQYNFTVKHSTDPQDLLKLSTYDLVIYDNNTDAGGVTNTITAPQQALMDYMKAGGKFLGIHAASDDPAGWKWYDTTLLSNSKFINHTEGAFNLYNDTTKDTKLDPALTRMWAYAKDTLKIVTDLIPFNTEIYHFTSDVRGLPNIKVIQELRGASAQNKVRETFSWVKILPNGGKMLYTGMGHETAEWTANSSWLTKAMYAYMKYLVGDFEVATTNLQKSKIKTDASLNELLTNENRMVQIRNVQGGLVATGTGTRLSNLNLNPGIYFLTFDTGSRTSFSRSLLIK
jgi:hypothetical protein